MIELLSSPEGHISGSLERKETRRIPFGFFRADYPESNDEDYFLFLAQRLKGNVVEFSKIEINTT